MAPLRVVLVDDSPEFLESAARFLSNDPRIAIAGRALCGSDAIELAERMRPDLLLIDLSMPDMNGLETTQAIKARPAPPRVIIMTLHNDPEYCMAAAAIGADGFITKSAFSVGVLPLITSLFTEAGRSDGHE
jgi:DNA-binding NarL/FixJ family response regulator